MRVSQRCYAVTGLGYVPPWTVNAGFVVGDDLTLIIDTGANALSAATIHGYAGSVRSTNIVRVLNCEKHFDHIGGNSFFEDHRIEIWGHPGIRRTEEEFASEVAEVNESIGDARRRANNEARVFFADTRLALPTHHIEHDLAMDLGNCRVEILQTPGHTETNLSVWVPSERVLYAADCLVNRYLPNVSSACRSSWIESVTQLGHLNPLVVVPGHGPVARDSEVGDLFSWMLRTLH